jgi:hypothetical protein
MNLRLLVTAFGVASIAVSLGSAGPQTHGLSGGKEPAYALTISAKQPESKAGSEIWLEVVFKNISNHDIEITPRLAYLSSAGHAESFYATDVRDEKGNSEFKCTSWTMRRSERIRTQSP